MIFKGFQGGALFIEKCAKETLKIRHICIYFQENKGAIICN